ncbi:2Fe-2S iron-sulfur cluster-binding protein [Bosea sp. PAMC 26642]|uniref:2Fe-2S iron-sulfur cluster-binding protein n=1 Tax=Bosea sp. (strain PAMC 26642) TaxID=1792307 RepID=UPI0007700FF6|nr:2Fe-2S iron-sulfur cluster-binding protein [Bosea sp. PAMC 26642]AMJ59768.1 ferredoxin [Bosea sp. PAMC 26642]
MTVLATLHVTDRHGRSHELDTVEGWRVMEILRDCKVGIDGLCGGSCDCATCHVVVAPDWAHRLPEPRADEIDALDTLPLIEPTSRLSCQIIWADALDGLRLHLPEAA